MARRSAETFNASGGDILSKKEAQAEVFLSCLKYPRRRPKISFGPTGALK
jgi:hypothetical protein